MEFENIEHLAFTYCYLTLDKPRDAKDGAEAELRHA